MEKRHAKRKAYSCRVRCSRRTDNDFRANVGAKSRGIQAMRSWNWTALPCIYDIFRFPTPRSFHLGNIERSSSGFSFLQRFGAFRRVENKRCPFRSFSATSMQTYGRRTKRTVTEIAQDAVHSMCIIAGNTLASVLTQMFVGVNFHLEIKWVELGDMRQRSSGKLIALAKWKKIGDYRTNPFFALKKRRREFIEVYRINQRNENTRYIIVCACHMVPTFWRPYHLESSELSSVFGKCPRAFYPGETKRFT